MKYLVGVDIGTYDFNKTTKTITIEGIDDISLEQILLITNVSSNTVIYQFNKPGYGATINKNIIVLDYNTSSMNDDDNLQIFIDYKAQTPSTSASSINQYTQTEVLNLIYEELQLQTKILKKIYQ